EFGHLSLGQLEFSFSAEAVSENAAGVQCKQKQWKALARDKNKRTTLKVRIEAVKNSVLSKHLQDTEEDVGIKRQ
ncbi:hypothetical protein TorRG33x02_203370, partial [Trema orientale]